VAFDWNSVASPPGDGELEITVIGPGYGESIVIHCGNGAWIIVDSCVDTTESEPRTAAALNYLRAVGVRPYDQVQLVVATHWHDDHIQGIGQIVETCTQADFCCACTLLKEEFVIYVEEMCKGGLATSGAKLANFRRAIRAVKKRDSVFRYALAGKLLLNFGTGVQASHGAFTVTALSPSDLEYQIFLQEIGKLRPRAREPKRAAVARTPNLAAVVLHVQRGDDAMLLGADLETSGNPLRGWTAVVTEALRLSMSRAQVVKVPHHGSYSSHHPEMWTKLLSPAPTGVLTPYNRGAPTSRPPTDADVERIAGLCGASYVTTRRFGPRGPVRDAAVARGLRESGIVTRSLQNPIGIVRLRKRIDAGWRVELFPPACPLERFAA
jgi:hypothetical protein